MHSLAENELRGKSKEFQQFYRSLQFIDPRDGPQIDSQALLALTDAECAEAEDLLIERIEGIGGPVVKALADMKSQRGATALKERAEQAGGSDAAEIALALWQIERWPRAEAILIEVLEGRRKYFPDDDIEDLEAMGRADAARALGEIPTVRVKAALRRALGDQDGLVRHWAQSSLGYVDTGQLQSAATAAPRRWWEFWRR